MSNYDVESQTSLVQNNVFYFILIFGTMLVRPVMKRLFCLKAKNGLIITILFEIKEYGMTLCRPGWMEVMHESTMDLWCAEFLIGELEKEGLALVRVFFFLLPPHQLIVIPW